jgi:hypothetical protein
VIREVRVERGLLAGGQHLEHDDRLPALQEHFPDHGGLVPVMVAVVVLLADQHEIGVGQRGVDLAGGREPAFGRHPYPPDQGMFLVQGRYPAAVVPPPPRAVATRRNEGQQTDHEPPQT